MDIRIALPKDLERMCEITDQAKARLKEMGINQWQSGYPSRDIWNDDISKGRAYVVENDEGEILGQFVYLEEDDPSYGKIDGAWLTDMPYACIHRVAVADEACGRGIAQIMFAHAFEHARHAGYSSVRIDTHEDNVPMQRALEKAGFVSCGTIHLVGGIEDGASRRAFERLL